MKTAFFLIFILGVLIIGISESRILDNFNQKSLTSLDPIETRYFRSDKQTFNGLTAYVLNTTQSTVSLSTKTMAKPVNLEATLRPTNDTYKGFPYPTGSHFDKVNDTTPDDSNTYIRTGDSTAVVYDRFGKPSFTLPSGKKIAFIRVVCRGFTDKIGPDRHGEFKYGIYINGNYYMSGFVRTENEWKTFSKTWMKNPATGQEWTESDINNLEIAVAGRSYYYSPSSEYYYALITQVYLEVYTYEDDTVYYAIDVLKRHSDGTESLIAAKVAQWSGTISSLYNSPGLKSATASIPQTSLLSTDTIVIRTYQKVGSGSWNLVENFTTEQLGARSLDSALWNVYYYLDVSANTSYVYTSFWYGTNTYNSRIENFTWTMPGYTIKGYALDFFSGNPITSGNAKAIIKESGENTLTSISDGYFEISLYTSLDYLQSSFTIGIFTNTSNKTGYSQLVVGFGSQAQQTQACSTEKYYFRGIAVDEKGKPIESGKIKVGVEAYTNSTQFSNGIWEIEISPCLIPGEVYNFKFLIEGSGKKGFFSLNQLAK